MKKLHKSLVIIVLFSNWLHVNSQDLPPITTYTPKQYNADNQNWAISQSEDKTIYIANNKGLLEFNGAHWNLYPTPNESIIRSVKAINNRIYTGCYMDFGYWERNEIGFLEYTSLAKDTNIQLVDDEQFWNIINLDNWLLFQSLNRIYIYNIEDKTFRYIESETKLTKAFLVDESIYFQKLNQGVYILENGEDKLVFDDDVVKEDAVVDMYEHDNRLLIVTQNNGIYKAQNQSLEKWNINASELIDNTTIYSSIKLKDNSILLGTISQGVLHLTEGGNKSFKIDQQKGLSNNTVLSLFEDLDNNIWLGLDNGINCINMSSPYTLYRDVIGELGTVYTSAVFKDYIYLGTNQGLFYKPLDSNQSFNPVNNLKGQVWNLIQVDNKLFCGHDLGTFLIEKESANKISDEHGTWNIIQIPNKDNLLLQGNYRGLHILEKIDNSWRYRNKIEGIDMSSRYFEFLNPTTVMLSHEYKGVFKVGIDENYTKVTEIKKDPSVDKGIGSSLVKYRNNIYYTFKEGIFKYNTSTGAFEKEQALNGVYENESFTSGKLHVDTGTDKIWSFSKENITYISQGKLSNVPKINRINLPGFLRNSISGYENITHLKNEQFLIGSSDGYLIIDLDKQYEKAFDVKINSVSSNQLDKDTKYWHLSKSANLQNKENNIRFAYSATGFDGFYENQYQYRLKGLYNDWSEWSTTPNIYFKNLPHGNYVFEVRAKIGNTLSNNTASFVFSIEKPWYLSNIMIIAYALGFLLLYTLVHYFHQIYYKKQREELLVKSKKELELKELENKQQLMQFKNESLQQDIKNKNRELAISTMSLIKKNEFLNDIKDRLKDNANGNLKPVIKLINKNINNSDDWDFFEEAFNNADKDFLKKIKSTHPNLTPNDLRLCAYLRLNLSSKEIAPLLNISHKSVEVKRYRLRKKMGLSHDTGLTDYILNI